MKKCKNCGEPTTYGMFCDYCRTGKERPTVDPITESTGANSVAIGSSATATGSDSVGFYPGDIIHIPSLTEIRYEKYRTAREQQEMRDKQRQGFRQAGNVFGGLSGP